jgi:Ca-activated chloride channel family protein
MTSLKYLFVFLTVVSLQLPAQAREAGWKSVRLNQEGVLLLKAQNFAAAQERFIRALAENPMMAALHINLGLTFLGLQQMEKAEASFATAARLADSEELRFIAYYNLGELQGKAKKTDEALRYYQAALNLKPDSRETKVNIELLIQDQQKQDQGGQGEQDDKDQKDKKDQQDQKDQKDNKDSKDSKQDKDQDQQDKEKDGDKPKQYQKEKPQPKPFKSEELTQGDVNKILGELKQQEQKIRSEFNRRDVKEKPRDKDW